MGVLKAYGVVQIKRKVGAVLVNLHFDAAMNLFSFQLKISEESFKDIQSFRKLIAIGIYDEVIKIITLEKIGELMKINAKLYFSGDVEEI